MISIFCSSLDVRGRSPPADEIASSDYRHDQERDLPQQFGDSEARKSASGVASVVAVGVDKPSNNPASSGH